MRFPLSGKATDGSRHSQTEEIMHTTHLAVCLLAAIAVPASNASVQSNLFKTATIVRVREHQSEPSHSYGGDNPSDAPLKSEIYVYEVAIRAGCDTYIARYASPYDYLPTALTKNRQMPVRVGKHDITFDLGNRQMQLPIARSKKDKTANCRDEARSKGGNMHMDKNDFQLLELLSRAIKDFEKIEDDASTMNFIARRVGNIVKHMKDLRDDLRPRGQANGEVHNDASEGKAYRVVPGSH